MNCKTKDPQDNSLAGLFLDGNCFSQTLNASLLHWRKDKNCILQLISRGSISVNLGMKSAMGKRSQLKIVL